MAASRVPMSLIHETYSVFIGHIHPDTSKAELREAFQQCGSLVDSVIVSNPSLGGYNFGFARYADPATMFRAAKELNRWQLHGVPLVVDVSKDTVAKLKAEKAAGKVIDTGGVTSNAGKDEARISPSKAESTARFNGHLQDTMYLSRVQENCSSLSILNEKGQFMRTSKMLLEDIDRSQNTRGLTCFGKLHDATTGFQHVSEKIMTRCKLAGPEGEVFGRRKTEEFKSALKIIMSEIGEFLSQDEFQETHSDLNTDSDLRHESEDTLDKDEVSFYQVVETESKVSVPDNQTDEIEPRSSISDEQMELIIKQLRIRMKQEENEKVVKDCERNEFVKSEQHDDILEAETVVEVINTEQPDLVFENEKRNEVKETKFEDNVTHELEYKNGHLVIKTENHDNMLEDVIRSDSIKVSAVVDDLEQPIRVDGQKSSETMEDVYTRAYLESKKETDLFKDHEINEGSLIPNRSIEQKGLKDFFADIAPSQNSDMGVKDNFKDVLDVVSNNDNSESKSSANTSLVMEDNISDFDPAILDFHASAKFDFPENSSVDRAEKEADRNSLDNLFAKLGPIPRSSSHDSSLSDDSSKGIVEDSGVESDFFGAFTNRQSARKQFVHEPYDNPLLGQEGIWSNKPTDSSIAGQTENVHRWNKAANLSETIPNRERMSLIGVRRDVRRENDAEQAPGRGRGTTLEVESVRQMKQTPPDARVPRGRGRGLLMAFDK